MTKKKERFEKHSPEQFWTDWLAADEEKRLKMVGKMRRFKYL